MPRLAAALVRAVVLAVIAAAFAPVWASVSAETHVTSPRSRRPDPRIRQALQWLPRQPEVPIEVVDIPRLAPRIAQRVRRACGFVVRDQPRIYISSRCWAYERAEHNPFDAVALAGVIAHEMAHLEGADEAQARRIEIDLVRELVTRLPGQYRVRSAMYLADLRRFQASVECETSPAPVTFHTCGQADTRSDERKGEQP